MRQEVAVFDGYGESTRLEKKLTDWLLAEPRHVMSLQSTEARIFIRWRAGNGFHRHAPVFFKVFNTLTNGSTPEQKFKEFFDEHPNASIVAETCNEFFLIWLWADES